RIYDWAAWSYRTAGLAWEWVFGAASLVVALAALAAIPGLSLLPYGYFLESGGRVARTGKLSSGFIGVRLAARAGGIVLGAFLSLLPLRFTSMMLGSARIVGNPDTIFAWRLGHNILTAVLLTHIVIACARGGRLRSFLWPFPHPWSLLVFAGRAIAGCGRFLWALVRLDRAGMARQIRAGWDVLTSPGRDFRRRPLATIAQGYVAGREAVWNFIVGLRLPYYFSLGFRGLIGTWVWLAIPTSLLAAGTRYPALGWIGAIMLFFVVMYLPFLQTRFAMQNRLAAMFDYKAVRYDFRRAPLMMWIALTVALVSALPLYLLYIEYPPEQIRWLPELVFTAFLFPAHLLTGWAYTCAVHRTKPAHWAWRWPTWFALAAPAALYVLILFFVQYIAQDGRLNLYDQHAFVTPFFSELTNLKGN
ncbi:MAG TPA: hypothetical protein VGE52_06750, partial [Pirellulales bacterium]